MHPLLAKEKSVVYYINKYITDENGFSDQTRKSLIPCGSFPGKLYGLCKIHKDNYPLRPVVSMINTSEYKLAKFLDDYIKPNIPKDFMLNSTNHFLDKLKGQPLSGHETMVSYDVTSLFTNVPLQETIDIIIERLYSDKAILTPPFKKIIFKRMLLLCSQGMFMHNDVWFRQVDGVAMGSPLAPSLANMFMAHVESIALFDNTNTTPSHFPKLYVRYVDDCFALFDSANHHEKFLKTLNSLHHNLKFTVEIGTNTLPFLDVLVEIEDNTFVTRVFRKRTHTQVFFEFRCHHTDGLETWRNLRLVTSCKK
jgi:hypothetical protein